MPNHLTTEERIQQWILKSAPDAQFRAADIAKELNLSTCEVMGVLKHTKGVNRIVGIPSQRGIWEREGAES